MSGIDFLRAICDGKLAQPPICHLLGYRLVEVEPAIHVGSRVGTAEGRLEDVSGKLYAHATTTCMVLANGR